MGLRNPVSREFNGETFYCYSTKPLERISADLNATHYRKRGFRARVVKWKIGYIVFTCPAGNPEASQ